MAYSYSRKRNGSDPRMERSTGGSEGSQIAGPEIESRVINWMTSNPTGISAKSAAVLGVYAPHLKKASPARQGRLLSQLILEVCWDGRRRRVTVKLDELAIAQEYARLEHGDDDG